MSGSIASQFFQSAPFFFGSVPEKVALDQQVPGDWCRVAVEKLDPEGRSIDGTFHYLMENSTGDLYSAQVDQGVLTRVVVSLKSAVILLGTLPYTISMIAWRPINFFGDLVEFTTTSVLQCVSTISVKGYFSAPLSALVTLVCDLISSFGSNLSAMIRAPFYGAAMGCAALYGTVVPLEGMKRIGAVEKGWHGGASHTSDMRYRNRHFFSTSLYEDFQRARKGEVFFLAICMQKKGNLSDTVAGKPKYTLKNSMNGPKGIGLLTNKEGEDMNLITGNWTSQDWSHGTFEQKDGDCSITAGKGLGAEKVLFSCSKAWGEVYPQKSNIGALFRNLIYTGAFYPSKLVTAPGNAVSLLGNGLYGLVQFVRNCTDKEFSKMGALSNAGSSIFKSALQGAVALVGFAAYSGSGNVDLYLTSFSSPEFFGWNAARVFVGTTLALATLHAVHNPQGFQRTVHKTIERIDPMPMTDAEVVRANFFKKGIAILDGRYSLARLLGMHYRGPEENFFEVKEKAN